MKNIFFILISVLVGVILISAQSSGFTGVQAVLRTQDRLSVNQTTVIENGAVSKAGDEVKDKKNTYRFINGRWFTGNGFKRKNFYVVNGFLTSKRPRKIDSVIDLSNKYIIPPFAEAHTHNIGVPPTEEEMKPYIKAGIFYVMNQGQTFPKRNFPAQTEYPVEVIGAGVMITPSGSHITVLNERSAERGNFPGVTKNDLDGKTHLIINSEADLGKLDPFLSARPVFIKIILGFSEEYEKRKNDANYIGKRGIDPSLVPLIVEKAHRQNIKVSVHIETAKDFEVAVRSGVDIIAHLPGWRIGSNAGFNDTSISRWLISKEIAELTAKKKITVITTVTAGRTLLNPAQDTYSNTLQLHKQNLEVLRKAKVKLAIGSDYYQGTSLAEASLLGKKSLLGDEIKSLGVFDNAELLNLWCVQTPRFIFPGREIGELKDGYEASFLVLEGNPIIDFTNVTKIDARYKNGSLVE